MVLSNNDSKDAKNILANNFGGLNRTSSPFNIPINDASFALNVDFDFSGKVKKRKGTRVIFKEVTEDKVFPTEISSNTGLSFLVARVGTSLRVYDVVDDTAILLKGFSGVFRQNVGYPNYTILPGDRVRLLILHEHNAPVQLQIHESTVQNVSGGTSFTVDTEFQNIGVQAVYVNNEPAPFTYSYPTLTVPSALSNDVVVYIGFSWQWWAESLNWFGDNFHRSVNRFGVSQADQSVQIPTTIYSDLKIDTYPNDYGIIGFVDNTFDNRYIYKDDGKPQGAFEYSFGDGAIYKYSASQSLTPSPFFLTFGEESASETGRISESSLRPPNMMYIPDHNFSNYDIITFRNKIGDFINGLIPNQPYYIEVVDKDTVRLWENPDLTGAVSFIASTKVTFTDADIDYQYNWINVPFGHPYTPGYVKRIQFENVDYLLPSGIISGQYYYIFALDAYTLEVYFDEAATRRVDFVPRPERSFTDANVAVSPSNTITIANHLLFQRDGVRFYPYTGSTLPTGITAGQVYYVDPIDPNAFVLYSDKALTTPVVLTTTGSGDFILRIDGGTMKIAEDRGNITYDKANYTKVDIVRLRQLPFMDNQGIAGQDLYVSVNSVEVDANYSTTTGLTAKYSYQLFTDSGYTVVTDDTTLAKRLGFTGSEEIGVPRNAVIRITNTRADWVGSSAVRTPYNFDNGSWVPFYGISKFADYSRGLFPSVGTVFQSRLALAGFYKNPQTVVLSSRLDVKSPSEFYQYVQITDDNQNPDIDPLDILIPENINFYILGLIEWQRALYIFTENSVFRTYSDSPTTVANKLVGKVSSKGAINGRCIAITESSILFLSDGGVYDISPILEQEYRVGEASLKIRPYFGLVNVQRYKNLPWIAFDDIQHKLYVAVPREEDTDESSVLLVFDTIQKSWTEYTSAYYFKTYGGTNYTDRTLGRNFLIAHRLPCFVSMSRFNYRRYADFIEPNELVEGQNVVTTTPVFWVGTTQENVLEYLPGLPMNFLTNVDDVRVFYGTALDSVEELTFNVGFKKTNAGYIRLLTVSPSSGAYLVVVPKVESSYYGAQLWIDNVIENLTDLSFGTINFADACSCIYGSSGSGGDTFEFARCFYVLLPNQKAEVGFPYLAMYVSPFFSQDLLSNFKRIVWLHVMFENVRNRFRVEDVNLLTQQYSDIVNRIENDLNVNLAIIYQADNEGVISASIYNRPRVEKFDAWSTFKEPLQGIGYSYQLVVYSFDPHTWVMDGFQITGKPVGQRFISGDR